LTLLCGFAILFPTQLNGIDGVGRRWTDVIWMGMKRLHAIDGHYVKYVYYGLLIAYAVWGLAALGLTPDPLVLAVATGVMLNFAMGFSSLHTLYVCRGLMPKELQPNWLLQTGLVACAVFYVGISCIALHQQWPKLVAWVKG
jgi:hypothetical protein